MLEMIYFGANKIPVSFFNVSWLSESVFSVKTNGRPLGLVISKIRPVPLDYLEKWLQDQSIRSRQHVHFF